MNVLIDDENPIKMRKADLIQQATTRLRRRQLEEQLLGMMASIEEIQTQSKRIYSELTSAMTTTQQLTEYDIGQQHQQMDLLENQVKLLKSMQQQWFPFMSSNDSMKTSGMEDNEDCFDDDKTTSITMSRLSSLSMISSLFSRPVSRATSVSEFTDLDSNVDDYRYTYAAPTSAVLDQQWNQLYRNQRRLRTKNHRKRYQDRQRQKEKEDQEDVLADLVIANPPSMKQTKPSFLPLSKTQQVPTTIPLPSPPLSPSSNSCRSSSSTCQQLTDYYTFEQEEDDTKTDISEYYGSVGRRSMKDSCTVFDDTMDFLEQMDAALAKGEGYDDEFFQDMAFLLDHPELCNQPLADLAPLLEQHHQMETRSRSYDSTHQSSSSSPYLKDLCSSGWQWYRFLSVLSASYVVSLLKGPDDLLID